MTAPNPLKATTNAVLAAEMPLRRNKAGVHSVTTVNMPKPMKNGTHSKRVPAMRPSVNKCRTGVPGKCSSSTTKRASALTLARPKTRNDPPHRIGVFAASEQKFDQLRQKERQHDGDEQRHDAADVENRAPPHGRNEIRVQQAAG